MRRIDRAQTRATMFPTPSSEQFEHFSFKLLIDAVCDGLGLEMFKKMDSNWNKGPRWLLTLSMSFSLLGAIWWALVWLNLRHWSPSIADCSVASSTNLKRRPAIRWLRGRSTQKLFGRFRSELPLDGESHENVVSGTSAVDSQPRVSAPLPPITWSHLLGATTRNVQLIEGCRMALNSWIEIANGTRVLKLVQKLDVATVSFQNKRPLSLTNCVALQLFSQPDRKPVAVKRADLKSAGRTLQKNSLGQ